MSVALPKTYWLAPAGRRTALVLMAAAAVLWLTAAWLLADTLKINYLRLSSTLGPLVRATFDRPADPQAYAGLTAAQAVPAFLMLVLLCGLPLMVWNLLEEWATSYTLTDEGLWYRTLRAVAIFYPWSAIHGLRRVDPEADEPVDELIVDRTAVADIRNPLVRVLHQLAFGRSRVPIYAGVDARDELLDEIRRRSNLQPAPLGQGIETPRRSL